MKKNTWNFVTLIVLVVVLLVGVTIFGGDKSHPRVHAQTSGCKGAATTCLTGWAWADNTGWVSFNSDNAGAGGGEYEVDVDDAGNLSGLAWSSNVGWISFDRSITANPPSTGTPDIGSGSGPIARFDKDTGAVTGWARALAGCAGDNTTWNGSRCLVTGAGKANGTGATTTTTVTNTTTGPSTWTKRFGPGDEMWDTMDSSDDGSRVIAGEFNNGYLHLSTDYGVTWKVLSNAGRGYWDSVAMSADGKNIVAANYGSNHAYMSSSGLVSYHPNIGHLYVSNDYGETWVMNSKVGNWIYVAASSDGVNVIAVDYTGYVWTSVDYGLTLTKTTLGADYWYSSGSSANGDILIATVDDSSSGRVYVSTDHGSTWNVKPLPAGNYYMFSTICSNGNTIVTGNQNGYVYVSNDRGSTWNKQTSLGISLWNFATCSAGSNDLFVSDGGNLYQSNNLGSTWSKLNIPTGTQQLSLAPSGDGKRLVLGQLTLVVNAAGTAVIGSKSNIYTYGPSASTVVTTTSTTTFNAGWDGWIELSGTHHTSPDLTGKGGVTYNNSNGLFNGFAWGRNVMGWLQFSPSLLATTTCTGDDCGIVLQTIGGTCDPVPPSSDIARDVKYTLTPTGGTGPYTYNVSSNPFTVHETSDSSHDVLVTDSKNVSGTITCSFKYTGVVTNSCVLPAHATTTDPTNPNCTFTCLSPYKLNAAKTACVKSGTIIEQ